MEEILSKQMIGQRVLHVTYFELNHPDQSLFYNGFDTFDLGIEIELSNGFHWHIGWKENDRQEIGLGKFEPDGFFNCQQTDATIRWSTYLNLPIIDFEVIYVSEEWNTPAKCTIQFANLTTVTILLSDELNLNGSIPLPMKYTDNCEIYVFHSTELPQFELVQIILPNFSEEEVYKSPLTNKDQKSITTILISVLFILVILTLFLLKKYGCR